MQTFHDGRTATVALTRAEAREQTILSLGGMIAALARKVQSRVRHAEIDDLRSAGWVAAIRAVDAFDPTRGIPLAGYAARVIFGAMLNEIRRDDSASERARRTVRCGEALRAQLEVEQGRSLSDREVDAHVPGYTKNRARVAERELLSTDLGGRGQTILDVVPDWRFAPEAAALVHEEHEELHDAIAALEDRRRDVIVDLYFEDAWQHTVASYMGLSPQRVSQLHLSALSALRRQIEAA